MSPLLRLLEAATDRWSTTEWLTAGTWMFIAGFVLVEFLVLEGRSRPSDPWLRDHADSMGGTDLQHAENPADITIPPGRNVRRREGRHPIMAAGTAFVAWDFSGWIYHLIGHHTRLGRAAHSPHHTGSEFNATLALRLTWMPWHGLAHHPLLALAGFRFDMILGCLAIPNALQALQHSTTLPAAPRWLGAIVMTPGAHRQHHGSDGASRNLGPVLTIWDRMAGTWHPPELIGTGQPAPADLVADETPGAIRTELNGWVGRL